MRVLSIFLLVFSLSGCFIVKDFGAYWDKGIVDADLESKWVNVNDSKNVLNLKSTDDHYVQDGTKNTMKTLVIGEHKFMMIIDNTNGKNSMNMLVNYEVKDNNLKIYQFKQELYEKIQKEIGDNSYKVKSGKISSLAISTLTEDSLKSLEELAKDRKYWAEFMIYKKVSD